MALPRLETAAARGSPSRLVNYKLWHRVHVKRLLLLLFCFKKNRREHKSKYRLKAKVYHDFYISILINVNIVASGLHLAQIAECLGAKKRLLLMGPDLYYEKWKIIGLTSRFKCVCVKSSVFQSVSGDPFPCGL